MIEIAGNLRLKDKSTSGFYKKSLPTCGIIEIIASFGSMQRVMSNCMAPMDLKHSIVDILCVG